MANKSTQSGYSLVEVLVSVSVLLIAIIGPMTIAAQGIKSSSFALEQNTAFFLAQEGIEGVYALQAGYALGEVNAGFDDSAWDWVAFLNSNECSGSTLTSDSDVCDIGVDFSTDVIANNFVDCNSAPANCLLYFDETDARAIYSHDATGATESAFTRTVTLTRRSAYAIEIMSTVEWDSRVFPSSVQTVSLTTVIFDTL